MREGSNCEHNNCSIYVGVAQGKVRNQNGNLLACNGGHICLGKPWTKCNPSYWSNETTMIHYVKGSCLHNYVKVYTRSFRFY